MDILSIETIKGLNSLRWSQGGETSIEDLMEYLKCDKSTIDTIIKPYIDCGFISEWIDTGITKPENVCFIHHKRMFIIHIDHTNHTNHMNLTSNS